MRFFFSIFENTLDFFIKMCYTIYSKGYIQLKGVKHGFHKVNDNNRDDNERFT